MQRHFGIGHVHTRSRTAYPPWLWLSRMWGEVKEIYQRREKKKNSINKTQQEKKKNKPKPNQTQNMCSNKRPVKKPATKTHPHQNWQPLVLALGPVWQNDCCAPVWAVEGFAMHPMLPPDWTHGQEIMQSWTGASQSGKQQSGEWSRGPGKPPVLGALLVPLHKQSRTPCIWENIVFIFLKLFV